MDREKLYDYLLSVGRPMSIGEICMQRQFFGCDRREVSVALRELADEDLVFRSIKEGKAYYSTNSADGVSRNPTKQFIANIGSGMNEALFRAQNPEQASLGDLFSSLRQLFGALDMEGEAEEPYAFTYRSGVVADCEDYTIAIPDGFVLEMGADDRDFVAWLPGGDPDDREAARITLYAGQISGASLEDLGDGIKSVEMCTALVQATQWKMRTQTERFLGPSEIAEIPLVGEVAGSYMYNGSNYQIMVGFPFGIKQMRVTVNDFGAERETYHQAVVDWIGTMRLKIPFAKPKELDSAEYLPLTQASLQRWEEALDERTARIAALNNMRANVYVAQYQYDDEFGNASITMLKRNLRSSIKSVLPYGEELCESVAAFLERACAQGGDEDLLEELQEAALGALNVLGVEITLDGDAIEEKSPRIDELRGRMEGCIAAWKNEKANAERMRREREEAARRAEEERFRDEEATVRIARASESEPRIRQLTAQYNNEVAQAEQSHKNACANYEREISRLEAEKSRLQALLPTFGALQMAKKGETRAKIANIDRDLNAHRSALAERQETYAGKLAELKRAYDENVEKAKRDAERKHPMPVRR